MRLQRCDLCHIDLDRVSVRRGGQQLLQDVSLHIHCGQLTALIGQNGAGKTTLIRALLGEIPHAGAIRHLDSAGRDLSRLVTGYVPQHLPFDPEMPLTVRDFLAAALTSRPVWSGISRKVSARVAEALTAVEAADLADRPLGRCSGGELQRVLLALALQPSPDLLVLDEPVSGVDRNGLKLFLDTVTRLKESRHIAILLVSHDLRLVREYADHVILLDKSVLVQGDPESVFLSPEFEGVFGTELQADQASSFPAMDLRSLLREEKAGEDKDGAVRHGAGAGSHMPHTEKKPPEGSSSEGTSSGARFVVLESRPRHAAGDDSLKPFAFPL